MVQKPWVQSPVLGGGLAIWQLQTLAVHPIWSSNETNRGQNTRPERNFQLDVTSTIKKYILQTMHYMLSLNHYV